MLNFFLSGGCEDRDILWSFFTNLSIESIYLSPELREMQTNRKERKSFKEISLWRQQNTRKHFCLTNHADILHKLCFLKLHFSCRSKSKVKDVTKKVNSHFISLRFPIEAPLLSKSQKCQALATDLPTDGRIQWTIETAYLFKEGKTGIKLSV